MSPILATFQSLNLQHMHSRAFPSQSVPVAAIPPSEPILMTINIQCAGHGKPLPTPLTVVPSGKTGRGSFFNYPVSATVVFWSDTGRPTRSRNNTATGIGSLREGSPTLFSENLHGNLNGANHAFPSFDPQDVPLQVRGMGFSPALVQ